MHPSVRLLSTARTPLIRFLGKRVWPSRPEAPHAHPYGPPELPASFRKPSQSAVAQTSSTKTLTTGGAFTNFWEAPERFWKHDLNDAEMAAIESGGASLW
ncbi:uncharacterized protein BT62DRAFT_950059 [Guyanagaster necrorhizus]|uniref:Uncharacterized protein n=1 Tax=Guyanagaster necrorhizus TaxID=856835 RepID=A0A9P7VUE6_9AGAR|nr:uncharacterized protein BT62DRAFT_950059 [Guyanagaster necrorhizus MCA 3950]KAG7446066.1 hypothetical protein BT62DRAFT_950059 [Guyanagaster necrorhizus MCA 3950]